MNRSFVVSVIAAGLLIATSQAAVGGTAAESPAERGAIVKSTFVWPASQTPPATSGTDVPTSAPTADPSGSAEPGIAGKPASPTYEISASDDRIVNPNKVRTPQKRDLRLPPHPVPIKGAKVTSAQTSVGPAAVSDATFTYDRYDFASCSADSARSGTAWGNVRNHFSWCSVGLVKTTAYNSSTGAQVGSATAKLTMLADNRQGARVTKFLMPQRPRMPPVARAVCLANNLG